MKRQNAGNAEPIGRMIGFIVRKQKLAAMSDRERERERGEYLKHTIMLDQKHATYTLVATHQPSNSTTRIANRK
jgi:hypothetical protein